MFMVLLYILSLGLSTPKVIYFSGVFSASDGSPGRYMIDDYSKMNHKTSMKQGYQRDASIAGGLRLE